MESPSISYKDYMAAMRVAARRCSKLVSQPAHPWLRGEQLEAVLQTALVLLRLSLSEILDAVEKYLEQIAIGLVGQP